MYFPFGEDDARFIVRLVVGTALVVGAGLFALGAWLF